MTCHVSDVIVRFLPDICSIVSKHSIPCIHNNPENSNCARIPIQIQIMQEIFFQMEIDPGKDVIM